MSSIPEAFGDPDNFIATLTTVVPPTLKPEHIGVPFPQISVLTQKGKYARIELLRKYQQAQKEYSEFINLVTTFLSKESEYRDKHPN